MAVRPGERQFPAGVSPLVFIVVRVESDLRYALAEKSYFRKTLFRPRRVFFRNLETRKLYSFFFEDGSIWKGIKPSPFVIDADATIVPALIALPPGSYRLDAAVVHDLDALIAAEDLLDLSEFDLQVVVPERDFVALGTLTISLKEERGVGDVLQGLKLMGSEKAAAIRPSSGLERQAAISIYPFLDRLPWEEIMHEAPTK